MADQAALFPDQRCLPNARLCKINTHRDPTGRTRIYHSKACPDKPGAAISVDEYRLGRQWPRVGGEPR